MKEIKIQRCRQCSGYIGMMDRNIKHGEGKGEAIWQQFMEHWKAVHESEFQT